MCFGNGNKNEIESGIDYIFFISLTLHHHMSLLFQFRCVEPFYGPLCGPILEKFPHHRYQKVTNYFTGKNFGSIEIKWDDNGTSGDGTSRNDDKNQKDLAHMQIDIHNMNGEQVLTTGSYPLSSYSSHMTNEQLRNIVGVSDGHFIPYIRKYMAILFIVIFIYRCRRQGSSRIVLKTDKKKKKL